MKERDLTYTIRNIPNELWKQARIKAIRENITMRDLILKLLKEWIKNE